MTTRPGLKTPTMTVEGYIDYWGSEHYLDFCEDLGVKPMAYWPWVAVTKEKGVDWWLRELRLDQITRLPDVAHYRMLVREAHPDEADGPRRLAHYLKLRITKERLDRAQLRRIVSDELGGRADPSWMQSILQGT